MRKHTKRAVWRRVVVAAVETAIILTVMLGTFELIGWLATMATAWTATL